MHGATACVATAYTASLILKDCVAFYVFVPVAGEPSEYHL